MSKVEAPAIVYVDDEPLNLRVFEANFRNRFRVVTCDSGLKALELLQSLGEVAILVSDQRMPGMSGVELLEKAREQSPDTQRMLITAYSDMQAVMDAVNRGQVSRYFVKPWIKEDLLAALDDAMRIYTLQTQLRETETRLLRSERLAAIGQVSAGIAHELMNPVSYMSQNIAALRGELEVLSGFVRSKVSVTPDDALVRALEDLPQILDDIETGAKHIRQVALGIRNQARGDDAERSSDLADVAGFAVKLARAEVRQKAKLVAKGESVRVMGGPVKLCQVLLNLIVNAAQAMEGAQRPGLVELRWFKEGDRIRVDVSDNGMGIPPQLHQKVFEPLFTTKPIGIGTGLGLAICRDLVQGFGGDISLTSKVGEGTVVTIHLLPETDPPPPEGVAA